MQKNEARSVAEKIRTQYVKREATELDALRDLDRKVKRPVHVFAYTFGSVGAVILGAGMSLVMTDIAVQLGIAESFLAGTLIGAFGLTMVLLTYPLHRCFLSARKKKYRKAILDLSEEVLKNEK